MSAFKDLIARAKARTLELNQEKLRQQIDAELAANGDPQTVDEVLASKNANEVSILRNTELNLTKQSNEIQHNEEQSRFISLAHSGEDCVLVGAAGTGKTTTMKGTIAALLSSSSRFIPTLQSSHKHLSIGTPGIIACSYTRRSVQNLRRAMPADMATNCITIHKLLEFQPEWYTVLDELTGLEVTKMNFVPNRNMFNPLDTNISVVIIDEASTVSTELFKLLTNALSHKVQFIFLGDIQQLPPVFGSAILGFKGVELEQSTVELKQVYRQALESPIIKLAHRILSGVPIPLEEYPEWKFQGQLTLHPWKKKISADNALLTTAAFFKKAYDSSNYDPEQDMILIPFNKACGTDELNKHIANHIARSKSYDTYEIIAGFNKLYLSVGDTIMYDKTDATVVKIEHNGAYTGKWAQPHSKLLDYWGHRADNKVVEHEESEDELEARLESMISLSGDEVEDRTTAGSHIVTIRFKDLEQELELSSSSALNSIALGYTMTVHKSQGSEWRKVFVLFHQSHATMIQRELLYTAVTRAREELYVICEPDTFTKGILGQRIKGETLAEKFEWFKGKIKLNQMES